ncbi:hypothetical protein IFM89_038349 [Coptis chinensis]|uniref:Pentatricopeptide repeat-containing protein n=1 Tax=Coptis chinensis TaxID=261450 RepID=A0A835M664_9MAGN|nr:hypothetical protein IFM89_038349 [Coptis chinensis]
MVKKGCSANASTFNPIFRCIMKLKDVNAAHRMYTKMKEMKSTSNTVTYNVLMKMFAEFKSADMVFKLKQEMDENECGMAEVMGSSQGDMASSSVQGRSTRAKIEQLQVEMQNLFCSKEKKVVDIGCRNMEENIGKSTTLLERTIQPGLAQIWMIPQRHQEQLLVHVESNCIFNGVANSGPASVTISRTPQKPRSDQIPARKRGSPMRRLWNGIGLLSTPPRDVSVGKLSDVRSWGT